MDNTNEYNEKDVFEKEGFYSQQISEKISVLVGDDSKINKTGELSACVADTYGSFQEIFYEIIPRLLKTENTDIDGIHTAIIDLKFAFDHIREHIASSDAEFWKLINILAAKEKSEENKKIDKS